MLVAGAMKRDYEIYIYGKTGVPTLVLHSIHFNDVAAIQRARTFAGDRRFEVWSDSHDHALDQSLASTLVFRSFVPPQNPVSFNLRSLANNLANRAEKYEFRLCSSPNKHLLFAGAFASEDQALEHARRLLNRHKEMDYAEVWRGMKLVRQV
jgi:hypothetical protein